MINLQRTRYASIASTTTSMTLVLKDMPLGSAGRFLVGLATLYHVVMMALRAPSHFPGPSSRYWYGVQDPKNMERARRGSFSSKRPDSLKGKYNPVINNYKQTQPFLQCRPVILF